MMNPKKVHDKLEALEARMRQLSSTNKQLIEALMTALKDECHILSPESHDKIKTALRDAGVEES